MRDKRARQEAGGSGASNPFIDRDGFRRFVAEAEQRFNTQLNSER
jgi:hypothetical protein